MKNKNCGKTVREVYWILFLCLISLAPHALLAAPRQSIGLPNPLGTSDLRIILGRVINIFLGGAGSFGLIMFVYGGFTWLTAAGSPEKIKKGRDTFLWATLGLVVMFGSYIFVRYILIAITTKVTQ